MPKRLTRLYDSRRRSLDARARREREWATTGVRKEQRTPRDNDKAQRDFRINRTEKLASRARRTEREAERLEVVDKPWEGWQLRFTINETHRSGDVVARLDSAVIVRGDFRLGPIDLQISWGDRLAIVGRNGAGKSTLVAAMLGRIPLAGGARHLGPGVVVGELGQERRALSQDTTLLDAVCARLRTDDHRSADLARQVRSRCRPCDTPWSLAFTRRANACRARHFPGAWCESSGARRADEPPRPPGDRAARSTRSIRSEEQSCSSRTTVACSSRCT